MVRFNGTYTGPGGERLVEILLPLRQLADECAARSIWLPVAIYVEETNRGRRQQSRGTEGADALLGIQPEAAHARQRKREHEG